MLMDVIRQQKGWEEIRYRTKEKIKSADIVMSYGLGALQFLGEEKAALLLYSEEQKHYENICEIEAFKRAFYTDGSGLRTEKETMICSYGLRTERMKRSTSARILYRVF